MYSTIVHILGSPRQQTDRIDVVVIGGGIVGMSTALAVARRGMRVALLERSSLARATGSSRGTARIYAPAAFPDDSYLEAGLRALERWREIEAVSGQQMLWRTGALHTGRFAERQLDALATAGVEAQSVSASDVKRRFGIDLPDATAAVYQPDAGVIRADRAWAAIGSMAREAGVELSEGERAVSIVDAEDSVVVRTESRSLIASAVVVAAGPWTSDLLAGTDIRCELEVTLQSVAYFDLPSGTTTAVALIDYEDDEPYSCWDPERGLKAALHARGPEFDPDDHKAAEALPETIGRVSQWVASRYPTVDARMPSAVDTCMYTNAPDEQFVLERLGRVVVGSACSGQGFQFAPETGERLAQLAAEVATPDLAPGGARR